MTADTTVGSKPTDPGRPPGEQVQAPPPRLKLRYREEIAAALSWHLCRCGVHNRVMDAVALAARRLREGAPA